MFSSRTIVPYCRIHSQAKSLQLTRGGNGRALGVLDSTAARTSGLESPDNVHGLIVGNLAENDVAPVKPRGDDGGDEELRAVPARLSASHPVLGIW